jgi:hypothetical protein
MQVWQNEQIHLAVAMRSMRCINLLEGAAIQDRKPLPVQRHAHRYLFDLPIGLRFRAIQSFAVRFPKLSELSVRLVDAGTLENLCRRMRVLPGKVPFHFSPFGQKGKPEIPGNYPQNGITWKIRIIPQPIR